MELRFGNIQAHLKDNLSYKWTASETGCVRGYAYVGEQLLEDEALLNYLTAVSTQEEMLQRIVSLNGLYSFILYTSFGVVACVDQVRSMPLFYRGNELFDALDEDVISGWEMDQDALAVYRNCVFTPNKKTLFEGTYQIQTGYYLLFDSSGAHQYPHFTMEYAEQQITDMDEAIRILDESFTKTARRVIEILNGRTVVIPLSGGHDSRILTYYLKHLGYQNIITYSYGLPGNPESVHSQKVAEILDIPWHFVYSDPAEMHKLYQKEFRQFALFAGNGTSIPVLQGWFAVDQLHKKGVFPENCVFVPGYGGDFTAGEFIWRDAAQAEPIATETLIQFIMKYEFVPDYTLGREKMCREEDKPIIRAELQKEFTDLLDQGRVFTAKEASQIVDQAIVTGWYSKFIANAVRIFDYFGYKWLMPFFERSQFETWSRIDNSLRRNEIAYFEQAKRAYPDELNAVGFALSEDPKLKLEKMLQNEPSVGHYTFGYFNLGEDYYQQIRKGILKGPNVYIQEEYLDILQEISSGKKKKGPCDA